MPMRVWSSPSWCSPKIRSTCWTTGSVRWAATQITSRLDLYPVDETMGQTVFLRGTLKDSNTEGN